MEFAKARGDSALIPLCEESSAIERAVRVGSVRRQVATIEDDVSLLNWRVLQSWRGEHHLVGTRVDTGRNDASSAIRQFDLDTMVGITHSGRRYHLIGLPGWNDAMVRTWSTWCALFCESSPIDVTPKIFASRHTECVDHKDDLAASQPYPLA